MASFQRGYTSGRHALKERPEDERAEEGVPVSPGFTTGTSTDSSEE
jgi:hypothetical protein